MGRHDTAQKEEKNDVSVPPLALLAKKGRGHARHNFRAVPSTRAGTQSLHQLLTLITPHSLTTAYPLDLLRFLPLSIYVAPDRNVAAIEQHISFG
jgi:hypothetical protein